MQLCENVPQSFIYSLVLMDYPNKAKNNKIKQEWDLSHVLDVNMFRIMDNHGFDSFVSFSIIVPFHF